MGTKLAAGGLVVAAALFACVGLPSPALAQEVETSSDGSQTEVDAEAPLAGFSLDTPLQELVDNQEANTVLLEELGPDAAEDWHWTHFIPENYTLNQVFPILESRGFPIPEEVRQRIAARLAAIRLY